MNNFPVALTTRAVAVTDRDKTVFFNGWTNTEGDGGKGGPGMDGESLDSEVKPGSWKSSSSMGVVHNEALYPKLDVQGTVADGLRGASNLLGQKKIKYHSVLQYKTAKNRSRYCVDMDTHALMLKMPPGEILIATNLSRIMQRRIIKTVFTNDI